MKKLIIALGAMAIANFSFNLPVMARLVDESEMYKAREYYEWLIKQNRNIYTNYDLEAVSTFLALNTCKLKDFNMALEVLKEEDYRTFVATLLIYNEDDRSLRNIVRLFTEAYCPDEKGITSL